MLFHHVSYHDSIETVIAVPKVLVHSVISDNHSTPSAGHMGVKRTIDRIRPQFYWPELATDVASFISRCRLCIMDKTTRFKNSDMPIAFITIQTK